MSSKKNTTKNDSSDKQAQAIRDVQTRIAENKKCFECNQRGPTYVDTTIGSFVCSKCSGVLRGITPPHRVKSISMSSFTPEEIEHMRAKGNAYNAKVWLGLYDKARAATDLKDDDSIRELIVQKYEKKRFYVDPSSITHVEEPELELPRTSSMSLSSPPSKFSSGLIGQTLQLHQQNRSQSAVPIPAKTASPPTAAKITSPGETNIPVLSFSSGNLSKIAAIPPAKQNTDPFGGSFVFKEKNDFFSGGKSDSFGAKSDAFGGKSDAFGGKSDSFGGKSDSFGAKSDAFGAKSVAFGAKSDAFGGKSDSFANFDAANIYSSPSSDPLHPPTTVQAPKMNFVFPPMAVTAPLHELKPEPVKQVPVPAPVLSGKQQHEDRYAALKDLDDVFKSSIELTAKTSSTPEPVAPLNNGPARSHNPFATDFNATNQLNTSPWPLSASPAGPGFATSAFGGSQNSTNFFPSPWDTPSAANSGPGPVTSPDDFFNSKNFTNPWPETHENGGQAFGQFGAFNKKNPFL